MGCDIHMHIELKVDGKWEHYAAPYIERDYTLFGMLAGVRNHEVIPISKPKGLPNDISSITKISRDIMGIDGHTDSWLNAKEIAELSTRLRQLSSKEEKETTIFLKYDLEHSILKTYLFENSFAEHITYDGCKLPNGVEDVRFVFWFDN